MKRLLALIIGGALAIGPGSAAGAHPLKSFASCAVLWNAHPSGLASSKGAAARALQDGMRQPRVSAKLYQQNRDLDLDQDGIACETPATTSAPANPTPAPEPQPSPAWQRVYTDIQSRAAARVWGPALYDVRHDPAMSAGRWQTHVQAISDAYGPWSQVAPMTSPIPVLIMDETSYDWYLGQDRLFPDNNCGSGWWTRYGPPNAQQMTGAGCTTRSGEYYFLQRLGSRVDTASTTVALVMAHEAVHTAQHFLLGNSKFAMPCWLDEGQAQMYGAALAKNSSMSSITAFRLQQTGSLPGFIRSQGGSSASVWLRVIQESENRGSSLCRDNGLGYSMGMLIMEKLYGDFGEDRILHWMRRTRSTGDWKAAFAETFGVDVNSWYQQGAAPYLAANVS